MANTEKKGSGKPRGRQRKSVEEILASFRVFQNHWQPESGLKILVDPQTSRVQIYEDTGDVVGQVVLAASGNTFCDVVQGMMALGSRSTRLPQLAPDTTGPVEIED